MKSLNKTKLSLNSTSKSKILKPKKSFQLTHENIIFFGKIKCKFLEHDKLVVEEIQKLPFFIEKQSDFEATQVFEIDTLEENSNFQGDEATQYYDKRESKLESTQVYDQNSSKKIEQLDSTQIYEENVNFNLFLKFFIFRL